MRSQGGWAASGGTAEQGQRCSGRGDAQRLLISPCPHCPCPCHPLPCAAADSCAAAGTFADPGDTCWRAGGEWIDTDPHDRTRDNDTLHAPHSPHPLPRHPLNPLTREPASCSTAAPNSLVPAARVRWRACIGLLWQPAAAVGGSRRRAGRFEQAGGRFELCAARSASLQTRGPPKGLATAAAALHHTRYEVGCSQPAIYQ